MQCLLAQIKLNGQDVDMSEIERQATRRLITQLPPNYQHIGHNAIRNNDKWAALCQEVTIFQMRVDGKPVRATPKQQPPTQVAEQTAQAYALTRVDRRRHHDHHSSRSRSSSPERDSRHNHHKHESRDHCSICLKPGHRVDECRTYKRAQQHMKEQEQRQQRQQQPQQQQQFKRHGTQTAHALSHSDDNDVVDAFTY
jgi:hypothetical protein